MKRNYDIEEPRRKFYDLPPVKGLKQVEYTTAWRDVHAVAEPSPKSPPHVQDTELIERDRMYGKAQPHKTGCHWPMLHCSCVSRRT